MNKTTLLKLAAGLCALMAIMSVSAEQVEPHYRVEVLVFVHADGRSDARNTEQLEDFTGLLDPERRARETSHQAGEKEEADEIRAAMELLDTLAEIEQREIMPELPAWPEPFLALETLSERMRNARDRIERSPDYDLLAWRAWHQPLSPDRAPTRVRIHDGRVLDADWIELAPTGVPAMKALAESERDTLMPEWHYRLDGGIRLRQRQFMHLDVDLHWRVPARFRPDFVAMPGPLRPETPRFEVHRLTQSRTVRPDRIEYFDSAWLGVLVLIEELEPLDGSDVDEDARPEEDPG